MWNDDQIKFVMYLLFSAIVILFITVTSVEAADYEEPEEICPYRLLVLTPEEESMLARCLEAECSSAEYCGRGNIEEGLRCKRATCQVILNRMMDPRFKAEGQLSRIICNPSQFTTYPAFMGINPSEETYAVVYEVLMGENLVVDYETVYFSVAMVPGTNYVATVGGHVFSK